MQPQEVQKLVENKYAQTSIRVKARQLSRRKDFGTSCREDIEQNLWLHLLTQAEKFDGDRSSLNTFIACVVDSAVAMMIRERKREKRVPRDGSTVESLAVFVEQPDGPPAPLATLISHSDLQRRLGTIPLTDEELYELIDSVSSTIASLPPELQQICRSLMERNRSSTERELRLSRRNYDAALALLRQHFVRAGLHKN